jgi:hypothetical protein
MGSNGGNKRRNIAMVAVGGVVAALAIGPAGALAAGSTSTTATGGPTAVKTTPKTTTAPAVTTKAATAPAATAPAKRAHREVRDSGRSRSHDHRDRIDRHDAAGRAGVR